jgi:hypothetical protein
MRHIVIALGTCVTLLLLAATAGAQLAHAAEPVTTREWRAFGAEPAWPPLDVPLVTGKVLGAENCPGCTSGLQAWVMEVSAGGKEAKFPWVTYGQLTSDQKGGDGTIHNARAYQNGYSNWMSLFYGELFQRGTWNTGMIYGCEAHALADGSSNTQFCANFHAKEGRPLAAVNVMADEGAGFQYAMIAGGAPIALDKDRVWTISAGPGGLVIKKNGRSVQRWR